MAVEGARGDGSGGRGGGEGRSTTPHHPDTTADAMSGGRRHADVVTVKGLRGRVVGVVHVVRVGVTDHRRGVKRRAGRRGRSTAAANADVHIAAMESDAADAAVFVENDAAADGTTDAAAAAEEVE